MASHAHSTEPGHREGYDFAHPFPVWGLLAVFVALTLLTIITVAQASFDLGNLDVAVTMVIATIKATLVMLFFMHLAFDKPFHLIIFLSSFVFVALFIIFTLSDARMNSPTFEQVYDEPPVLTSS
jgi:cytochrome c oxidase subunit IV